MYAITFDIDTNYLNEHYQGNNVPNTCQMFRYWKFQGIDLYQLKENKPKEHLVKLTNLCQSSKL